MEEIESWDVPFAEAASPSVTLLSEFRGDSTLSLVIAPRGLDAYPKYFVHFSAVYAFTCEEEAGSELLDRLPRNNGGAFIWHTSPAVLRYADFAKHVPFRGGSGVVHHYVVVGGDNVVGIVAAEIPAVETIESAITLHAKYAV